MEFGRRGVVYAMLLRIAEVQKGDGACSPIVSAPRALFLLMVSRYSSCPHIFTDAYPHVSRFQGLDVGGLPKVKLALSSITPISRPDDLSQISELLSITVNFRTSFGKERDNADDAAAITVTMA